MVFPEVAIKLLVRTSDDLAVVPEDLLPRWPIYKAGELMQADGRRPEFFATWTSPCSQNIVADFCQSE